MRSFWGQMAATISYVVVVLDAVSLLHLPYSISLPNARKCTFATIVVAGTYHPSWIAYFSRIVGKLFEKGARESYSTRNRKKETKTPREGMRGKKEERA